MQKPIRISNSIPDVPFRDAGQMRERARTERRTILDWGTFHSQITSSENFFPFSPSFRREESIVGARTCTNYFQGSAGSWLTVHCCVKYKLRCVHRRSWAVTICDSGRSSTLVIQQGEWKVYNRQPSATGILPQLSPWLSTKPFLPFFMSKKSSIRGSIGHPKEKSKKFAKRFLSPIVVPLTTKMGEREQQAQSNDLTAEGRWLLSRGFLFPLRHI